MPHTIQGSKEWHDYRRDKITASEIGIIMGVSPWMSSYQLWQQKLEITPPQEETAAMSRGKLLEADALREYCNLKKVIMAPAVITHEAFPFFMASLDGISLCKNYIVEIKCPGRAAFEEAKAGHVKQIYIYQMAWQMFVTGLQECDYCVYDGEEIVVINVRRDQELIDKMLIAAKEFLRCLRTITPPAFTDLDYDDKSHDPYWEQLENVYSETCFNEKMCVEQKERLKKQMVEYSEGRNVKGARSVFTKVITKGRVDYSKIPQLQGLDLEIYRGEPVESYRITLRKD
jgi:putative phage-type endonuclease